MTRLQRLPLASTAAGVALGLLGQAVPPFHVLGHESTQAFTVVAGLAALAGGYRAARHRTGSGELPGSVRLSLALGRVCLGLFALGTAFGLTVAVASALGPGCRPLPGAAWFAVTWPPMALLGAVIGVLLGAAGVRRRTVLLGLGAALLLTLTHDVLQAVRGVRIVDPWIGSPLSFDQRAGTDVPRVHVLQRAWVAGLAYAIWQAGIWRARRREVGGEAWRTLRARQAGIQALLATLVLAVCAVGFGDRFGLGWSRAAMLGHLSQERRAPGVWLRHAPGGPGEAVAAGVLAEAAWEVHDLAASLGVPTDPPVRVLLFDDPEDLERYTGIASDHAGYGEIRIDAAIRSDMLRHELVHALHPRLGPPVALLLSRGVTEGFATAWEEDLALLPEAHQAAAAALLEDTLPPARALMGLLGFARITEGGAYEAAGSFIGFLILDRGMTPFRALQARLDWVGAYGEDLDALGADWRAFLAGVPVDLEDQAQQGDELDPFLSRSYLATRCPKVGALREDRRVRARALGEAGEVDAAVALWRELWDRGGDPRDLWEAGRLLWSEGRNREAVAVVQPALDRPTTSDSDRDRLLTVAVNALLAEGDWPALDAALATRAALPGADSPRRRHAAACLRDPGIRAEVARALSSTDPCERRRVLLDLQADHPDDPDLLATSLFFGGHRWRSNRGVNAADRAQNAAMLALLSRSPEAADDLAPALLSTADALLREGRTDQARAIAATLAATCTRPLQRLRAERRLARIAWEAGGGS